MKVSDTIVWPKRWTTSLGNETDHAPVDNGILVDMREWEDSSTVVVVVRCRNAKYYGTIKTSPDYYEAVVQFLRLNMNRRLQEIKQAEITFPEPVS